MASVCPARSCRTSGAHAKGDAELNRPASFGHRWRYRRSMGRDAEGRRSDSADNRDLVYQQLYMPRGTSRRLAQTMLTMHAEYGGWELDRLRLYPDGSRRGVLRRAKRPRLPPSLPI